MKHFILFVFTFSFFLHANAQENMVPKGLWFLGNGKYYPNSAVIVDKTRRKLSLWGTEEDSKLTKIKEYISDQGKNDGDKQFLGDKKTPEGVYFFQEMLQGKKLPFELYGVRAFTTDYPNLFDKRKRKTGSGIWLHAIPDSESLERGSRGCVVIRNKSIIDLSGDIKLKQTPFMVFSEVEYISYSEHQEEIKRLSTFLKSWVKAWQTKNIDTYLSYYSEHFYANKMNFKQWSWHKKNLNENYNRIKIQLSDPVVFEVDGEIIVRTLQHYQSDKLEDYGEKFLYVKREADGFKILSEQWFKLPQKTVLAEISSSQLLSNSRYTSSLSDVSSQNKN